MTEHLEKTLSELRSQREQIETKAAADIAKVDAAIEAIQKLMNPNSEEPSANSGPPSETAKPTGGLRTGSVGPTVNAGDFFGKTKAEAAGDYLRRVGRAATLDDIFAALQKGGARLQGQNPKQNLYVSLVKNRETFALVAP